MRTLAAITIAGIALLGLAAPVTAHDVTFETAIGEEGNGMGEFFTVDGFLDSKRVACLDSRTVKLVFETSGERTLVDVDSSSRNGAWSMRALIPEDPPELYVVKVANMRLPSPSGHSHLCAKTSYINAF
jgi:hypothetical protein